VTGEDVFIEIGQVAPQEIWDGVVARSIHGERVTMALIELAPNSLVPEHSHVHEQVGILVRGLFRFRVGSDTRELGPGETWRIRGGVPHEVEVGPEGAVVVEIWSPPRNDWFALDRQDPRPPPWPE
jgi:quercetin dioxygenase-like cupin family protein